MNGPKPDRYPNATRSERPRPGLSRRTVLAGSAAAGATATAGCLGDDTAEPTAEPIDRPTVFVFNTGDGTVSLIDVETDSVVATTAIGMTASFPSNQFSPQLTTEPGDPVWLNAGEGVRAVAAGSLEALSGTETGSGANWQEQTPDGDYLVVSAREPAHRQFRIDADPNSERFGEVTGEIDRTPEGGRGDRDGPGPCDVTIHPDGEYAYVPDLFGETLTVIAVESFEIARQIEVDGEDALEPWMGTASWDGETLLVENNGGPAGSESIWDVSEPAAPVEIERLSPDDGLGSGPLTSEIGPNSEFGYVFTPGSEDVSVIDIRGGEVVDRLDLGGEAFVGSWDSQRRKLYVPIQTADEVAVIDGDRREIVERIRVGPEPYGATAATVRIEREGDLAARIDSLTGEYETTYCIGECACGHQL